jgi:hypothetical protein
LELFKKHEESFQTPGKSKENFKAQLKMATEPGLLFLHVYVQIILRFHQLLSILLLPLETFKIPGLMIIIQLMVAILQALQLDGQIMS